MPRSGTSFFCDIFNRFGGKFEPNLICNSRNKPLDGFSILSEPEKLSKSRINTGHLSDFLLNLINEYSVFENSIPVLKHFYFIDHLDQMPSLSYVKKIIVCTREVSSWSNSMSHYAPHSTSYLRSLFHNLPQDEKKLITQSNFIESFGYFLHNRCKRMLDSPIPTLHFNFNSPSSLNNILNDLNLHKSFIPDVLNEWKGSRFE